MARNITQVTESIMTCVTKKSNNNTESFSMADLDEDLLNNLIDKDVSEDLENYKMK